MLINREMDIADTVASAETQRRGIRPVEEYREFIRRKIALAKEHGISEISPTDIRPLLEPHSWNPHQKDVVAWAVRGGRRAIFASFGLGKTIMQLEIMRLILEREGGQGLIVCPLGVRQEFSRDAREKLGIDVQFIRSQDDIAQKNFIAESPRIFLTNYETVREGKIDPSKFTATSLDEAAILRSFGGTKTYREFMKSFENVKYRFVATATPDPNEYIELLAYSAYLGVMDVSQAKTRFFKRDSTKADKLTLHPHKEEEFWLWVASWAIFLQKPSDLGYDDTGYALPPMEVKFHEVPVDETGGGSERDGQARMFRDAVGGVTLAAREKRDTLAARVEVMTQILRESPDDHFLLWHDLEDERRAIEEAVPSAVSVYGAQKLEDRERAIIDFSDGKIKDLAAKPVLAGSGCNFQYHCHKAVFVGIGFKFNDWIQAVHRIYRFLQKKPVTIHLVYASSEKGILENLLGKWERYKAQVSKMGEIIRKYGLSQKGIMDAMRRSVNCERFEVSGHNYRMICNDAIEEAPSIPDNSVGLVLTSIPFSTQYEYSPSYQDFGHTESNSHFFEQMDFLTPHLFRVLAPGRVAVIHVKDRVVPGGLTGLGFQTVYPLHADCIRHYTAHGFGYMGMKTIVTDVVRENNQTYRLGWTEQCKDATKMGVGMPEYLLLFRKPPSSNERSYADDPVVKQKKNYTRGRWQIDAHGFTRSNGDRPLAPEDLDGVPHDVIFKLFRRYTETQVYDFERHVRLAEYLDDKQRLPVTFMLLQPASWSPDVWSDIARMRTLNMLQAQKGRQMHLCPMQFDIARRVIAQFSMPEETVLDPFAGIGTVPMCAVEAGRKAIGIELCKSYYFDACSYAEAAERKLSVPSLFAFCESQDEHPAASSAA